MEQITQDCGKFYDFCGISYEFDRIVETDVSEDEMSSICQFVRKGKQGMLRKGEAHE